MKKILVIDDDGTFRKTISVKLKEANYETISASDGEDGLNKALTMHPDLILLDIRMPGIDGITVLKKLRKEETATNIPVFITSNMSTSESIGDGVVLGVKG